ncbi:MAG: hypothetical protein QOI42_1836 [Frankiaceae bacterium]|nr:hypothetical protein [Frankiaceae bacterium]
MIVTLDPDSPVPPYEQIRGQIETMARAGTLPRGAPLPPIRRLAGDLGVASGTVARAYRELEMAGVVVTRGRHGTQVAAVLPGMTPTQRDERLAQAARDFATVGRQLGADHERLVTALRAALREG